MHALPPLYFLTLFVPFSFLPSLRQWTVSWQQLPLPAPSSCPCSACSGTRLWWPEVTIPWARTTAPWARHPAEGWSSRCSSVSGVGVQLAPFWPEVACRNSFCSNESRQKHFRAGWCCCYRMNPQCPLREKHIHTYKDKQKRSLKFDTGNHQMRSKL